MKCAPEWPPREPAYKDHLKLALQILWERHRKGESAASILKAYSRPEEGLKLSTLKLFLRPDHKGPVRGGTRHALIRAGRRAWAKHCPLAMLHDQLAAMLLGPGGRNSVEQFYGKPRWVDRRPGEPYQVTNAPVVIGPCAKCSRPLLQIKPREVVRCGFPSNVNSRLYVFAVERNYMRMVIDGHPSLPRCSRHGPARRHDLGGGEGPLLASRSIQRGAHPRRVALVRTRRSPRAHEQNSRQ